MKISSLGQKFGRLLILGQWKAAKSKQRVLAQCDCGKLKEYYLSNLKRGRTKSCGCFQKEKVKEFNTTHGMEGFRVYRSWHDIIQRCTNPKATGFKNYGGRGIKVCDRWLKFENFYEDMGDKPEGLQLDRIDNNQGYFKENCRWASRRINQQNTRISKYWFLYGKKYESSYEAAEFLGVTDVTIKRRCDGYSQISKAGVRYDYPPKPGCHSELKYK